VTKRLLLCILTCAAVMPAAPAHAQEGRAIPGISVPTIPTALPLLPLIDGTLFPGVREEVQIVEPRARALVNDVEKGNHMFGMVTLQPGGGVDTDGRRDVFPVGALCILDNVDRLPDGRIFIIARAVMKFRITKEEPTGQYRVADIEPQPESVTDEDRNDLRRLRVRIEELAQAVDPIVLPELNDADWINNFAFYMDLDRLERQALLDQPGVAARARAIIDLLTMKLSTKK
jgi:ATP-dependent Lon protease